jgi:MoaA/NifB/PqqE/SkfB family radical SAM enzyme
MKSSIKINESGKYLEIFFDANIFSAKEIVSVLGNFINKCSILFNQISSGEVLIRLTPHGEIDLRKIGDEISLKINTPTIDRSRRAKESFQRSFIVVTRRCINNCLFCTETEKKQWAEPTLEELKNLLNSDCRSFRSIVFSGGEPTLRKEIFELIGYAKNLGYSVELFSNGRLFANNEFAERAARVGLDAVLIPLHGPTAASHDQITQKSGSFEQTIAGMKNLDLHGVEVRIKIIPNKINYHHLSELASLAVSLPGNFVCMDMLVISGGALNHLDVISIKLSEMAPYIEKAIDVLAASGKRFEIASLPLCLISEQYRPYLSNNRTDEEINIGTDKERASLITTPGQILAPICRNCLLKNKCPGTWAPYFKIYGDNELKPIS